MKRVQKRPFAKLSWLFVVCFLQIATVFTVHMAEALEVVTETEGEEKPIHFVIVIATYPRHNDLHSLM
jgi:hypothetical protein